MTQPWLSRMAARQVEVYADRSRSCPVADPDDQGLFVGLGAAVLGIRLALGGIPGRHRHPPAVSDEDET